MNPIEPSDFSNLANIVALDDSDNGLLAAPGGVGVLSSLDAALHLTRPPSPDAANLAADGSIGAEVPPPSNPVHDEASVALSSDNSVPQRAGVSGDAAPSRNLAQGVFGFTNPFPGAVPVTLSWPETSGGGSLPASDVATPPTSRPTPLEPAQHASGGPTSLVVTDNFSSLSAVQLAAKLKQRIPALDDEAWAALSLDGATILEISSPDLLPGQLTDYLGLSPITRDRVRGYIRTMIISDGSIDTAIRSIWSHLPPVHSSGTSANPVYVPSHTPTNASNPVYVPSHTPTNASNPVQVPSHTPTNVANPVHVSSHTPTTFGTTTQAQLNASLAQTPGIHGGGAHAPPLFNASSPLTPAYLFSDGSQRGSPRIYDPSLPSMRRPDSVDHTFLSEVTTRPYIPLEHAPTPAPGASLMPQVGAVASAVATVGGLQNISITLHQPTQQQYNWQVLDSFDNYNTFKLWLKKNRREMVICDAANKRSLSSLCGQDVRDEVMRIYSDRTSLFVEPNLVVCSYADVTDELLLKILFYRFGPRSSRDARARLSEVKFKFDDSTTMQDRFGPKLRRFCTEFRQSLIDLKYTAALWPHGDDLSHQSIIDAFMFTFEIEDEIIGPDGRTKVPKSSGMQPIRDMIRENKHLKLDVIIDIITRRFEHIDATIRADPLLKHAVQPWKTTGVFNPRKRKFAQFGSDKNSNGNHQRKQQRTDDVSSVTTNPRCANCGSKGHKCSERTCYFWGHPKGRGASGSWPLGEASLRLDDEEYKAWKATRYEQFYSYAENKKNKSDKPKGGGVSKPHNQNNKHPGNKRGKSNA